MKKQRVRVLLIEDSGCAVHDPDQHISVGPYYLKGGWDESYCPDLPVGVLKKLGDTGQEVCSNHSTHQLRVVREWWGTEVEKDEKQ